MTRNKTEKPETTTFGFGEVLKRVATGSWVARQANPELVIMAHRGKFMSVQADGDVIGFVYISAEDQFAEDWYEVDKPNAEPTKEA
jgi:hypothetical protein